MQRRYKSGAQKRKEKKQHDERATAAVNQSHSLFSHGFTTQHSQPIHSDSGTIVSTNTALLESSTHTTTPEQYEPEPVLDHSVERNHCDTANCCSF